MGSGDELKAYAAEPPRVPYWEIAERIGVSENTVGRWLRSPTPEQAARVLAAIADARAARRKA